MVQAYESACAGNGCEVCAAAPAMPFTQSRVALVLFANALLINTVLAWLLSHLVYGQVGVWADDGACAEVDALAAQVAAEAALLALQPLHEAPGAFEAKANSIIDT
jgi:hypothetical protein